MGQTTTLEDMYWQTVQIVRIGTPVDIQGIPGQTHTMWEVTGVSLTVTNDGQIAHEWTLQGVSEDADMLDMPEITVNPDFYDYILI